MALQANDCQNEVFVELGLAANPIDELRVFVREQSERISQLQHQLRAVHSRVDNLAAVIQAGAEDGFGPHQAARIRELPEDLKRWVPTFLNQEFDDESFESVARRQSS